MYCLTWWMRRLHSAFAAPSVKQILSEERRFRQLRWTLQLLFLPREAMFDVRISHLPKCRFNWIRWSTVQLNLRWAHALMRRHRRLVMGAARMGDHNEGTSPARCCTSVTDSFQDGSSACSVPRLLFPCIALLHVWITARRLWSACALIVSGLKHSRVRSNSQPVVCLSVCLSLQTHAPWPEATRQRSCRLLTASRFLQRHALLPREGEQVNRV